MTIPDRAGLVALLRSEKRLVFELVATSLGRTGLSIAAILLIRECLAGLFAEGSGRATGAGALLGPELGVALVAGLLAAAYVGGGLFGYANQLARERLVKVVELRLMDRLIRHVLALPVGALERRSRGDLVQTLRQDVTDLRQALTSAVAMGFEAMLALGLLASALWISPWLCFWALLVLPAVALPVLWVARRALLRSFGVRRTGYVLLDAILEVLRAVRLVKIYGREEHEARSAVAAAGRHFDERIEMVRVRALSGLALETVSGLSIVLVVVVGGMQVAAGALTWPSLLAFLVAARALAGPLSAINTHYMMIQTYGAAAHEISALLEEKGNVEEAARPLPLPATPRRLEVDGVDFAYRGASVLQGIRFSTSAGETIGIAGPSGAGKTTLLGLLARFHDPSAGCIRLDGFDLRAHRVGDLHERVALVTQQPFLFAASVLDNIQCARPSASLEEVEAAARSAGIHEEILALPQGYETRVGANGRTLSVGQAQRLNLARALLKDAPILLLDEPAANLDPVAAAHVQRAIERLPPGRTVFHASHRLGALRDADRILVLDAGRQVGFAPHPELLQECSLYREMWRTEHGSADAGPRRAWVQSVPGTPVPAS